MTVRVRLSLRSEEFELGRILSVESPAIISLQTVVPIEASLVPFVEVQSRNQESYQEAVVAHPSVERFVAIEATTKETLYALDWESTRDGFLDILRRSDASVLTASGTGRRWQFELRLRSHDGLSALAHRCEEVDMRVELLDVASNPGLGSTAQFGLTALQRETLVQAVKEGYYSIPREVSTQALADQLDISDQAVTERLRRAIRTLATNAFMLPDEDRQ
ncbi:helix-turn-helix domain-containing protein [Halomarina salina]|uniref:Helix-turn-helix domain-containing protein n=1 Tax=Halomarina salina TaxID=1872699 RepID=A0ABD5RN68_9EURY|nr:helix-turn-helix domain-containing protein [Halomarina salina]